MEGTLGIIVFEIWAASVRSLDIKFMKILYDLNAQLYKNSLDLDVNFLWIFAFGGMSTLTPK